VPAGLVIGGAVIALNWVIRGQEGWTTATVQTATSILLSIAGLWVLALLSLPFNRIRLAIFIGMVLLCLVEFFLPWSLWFFSWVPLTSSQLTLTLIIAFMANAAMTVAVRLLR
jgi:cation-transporting ATPase E